MVRPGDEVKDKISGATGIVICRAEWQYGCVRLTIQPRECKDGKPAEPFTIDEPQADLISPQAVPDTRVNETPRSHGPRQDQVRPSNPTR